MKSIRFVLITIVSLSLPRFLFAGPAVTAELMRALVGKVGRGDKVEIKLVIKHSKTSATTTDWRKEFGADVSSYIPKLEWYPHADFDRMPLSSIAFRGKETPLGNGVYKFAAGSAIVKKSDIGKLLIHDKVVWLGLPSCDHMNSSLPILYPSDAKVLKDFASMLNDVTVEVNLNKKDSDNILPKQSLIPLSYLDGPKLNLDRASFWWITSMLNEGTKYSSISYLGILDSNETSVGKIKNENMKKYLPELFQPGPIFPAIIPRAEDLPSLKTLNKLQKQVTKDILLSLGNESLRNNSGLSKLFSEDNEFSESTNLLNFGAVKALPLYLSIKHAYFIVSIPTVRTPVEAYSDMSLFLLVNMSQEHGNKKWTIKSARLIPNKDCFELLASEASN